MVAQKKQVRKFYLPRVIVGYNFCQVFLEFANKFPKIMQNSRIIFRKVFKESYEFFFIEKGDGEHQF